MKKIDAINIPFYTFQAEFNLIKDIQYLISTLEFIPASDSTNGYVYPKFYNDKLFDFFNQSINEVKKIYYKDEIEFPIVDCWVNKYTTMNKLNEHNHPNSVICGLYYVTDHSDHGETIFNTKNPWILHNSEGINLTIHKDFKPLSGQISAEEGKLVLFPASLYHFMKPISKLNKIRYTIAFNTFPTGLISNWRTSCLNIETKGLM